MFRGSCYIPSPSFLYPSDHCLASYHIRRNFHFPVLFLVTVPDSRFSNIECVAIVGYLFGNATDVFGWILELHLIRFCL